MNFINLDFVTNSSSSNYIVVLKKKNKKRTEREYLMKALGINEKSSLIALVNHIEENKYKLYEYYDTDSDIEIRTKLVEDYGPKVAEEVIKLKEQGHDVFLVRVADDDGGEYIQQLIMYEQTNINNKYILFCRRDYGY